MGLRFELYIKRSKFYHFEEDDKEVSEAGRWKFSSGFTFPASNNNFIINLSIYKSTTYKYTFKITTYRVGNIIKNNKFAPPF